MKRRFQKTTKPTFDPLHPLPPLPQNKSYSTEVSNKPYE